MRIKTIAIFGVSYAVILSACLMFSVTAIVLMKWDIAYQKDAQNIAFIINMAAFTSAIFLSISWQFHNILGNILGPIAFRKILRQSRVNLAIIFALIAVLIDVCAVIFSSRHFIGEIVVLSLPRLGFQWAIYGALAWLILSHLMTKGSRIGRY